MLKMVVFDESGKAEPSLTDLFQNTFKLTYITDEKWDEKIVLSVDDCQIFLYVSACKSTLVAERINWVHRKYPKVIIILLTHSKESGGELGEATIAAHTILVKPCSKSRLLNVVDNYCNLLNEIDTVSQNNALLSGFLEFFGVNKPSLYVAYNRVMPLILNVCKIIDADWRRVQQAFMVYLILMSWLDNDYVGAIADGDGRSANAMGDVYEHVARFTEIFNMDPSTQELSSQIKYTLKRFNGKGFPKDNVKGLDIPLASRVVRLLMDYHYLIQSGKTIGQTMYILSQRKGWYDTELFDALVNFLGDDIEKAVREVYPLGLSVGMEIAEDVYGSVDGKRTKIIGKGEILTDKNVEYLQTHAEKILDITEPILVVEALFTLPGESDV